MKKAITLPEISISILIVTLALIIFYNLANNFIVNLLNAKKMFLLVNANQKIIELLIAWRNKQLESSSPQDWFPLSTGKYCVNFNNGDINLTPTSKFCDLNYANQKSGIILQGLVEIYKEGDFVYITSTVKTNDKRLPESKLNLILTNWHPYFSH